MTLDDQRGRLTRRAMLVGGAGLITGLTGCRAATAPPDDPTFDALRAVLAATDTLLSDYRAMVAAHPSLRKRLAPLRTDNTRHATTLRAQLASETPSPSRSASAPASVPIPDTPDDAVDALAGAEARAQRWAAERCLAISAPYALLIGSISACRATHAVALGGTAARIPTAPAASPSATGGPGATPGDASASPTPTDGTHVARLQDALAAEHAAVYAYGVIGPRLPDASQRAARSAEQAHRNRRDQLTTMVARAHTTPTPAAGGYDIPLTLTRRASVLRLAVLVEDRTAAVWGAGLADLAGADRAMALYAVTDYAVRAMRWRYAAGIRPFTVPFPARP